MKNKNIKTLIKYGLFCGVFTFCMCSASITTNAAGIKEINVIDLTEKGGLFVNPCGDSDTLKNAYVETAEDIKADAIKNEWLEEAPCLIFDQSGKLDVKKSSDCSTMGSSSQGVIANLKVKHVKQSNGYYCGPATTAQTVNYLTKKSYSQSTMAKALGTTKDGTAMGNIPGVVNKYVGKKINYTKRDIGKYGDFCTSLYTALSKNRPVILDIKADKGSGWAFTTKGHFCNVSGVEYSSRGSFVSVVDPNSKNSVDRYTAKVVYNVTNAHWNHAFIW